MRSRCQLPATTNTATATNVAIEGNTRDRGFRAVAPASGPGVLRLPVMKVVVIAGLIAIVVALFSALVFLYRDRGSGTRMVKALAIRVGLSILLVSFLLVSYYMGWIAPQGMR
jgi:hypothetical protein